ncbi:hypothetical protein O6H91_02G027600 [Diphasiastrum complanatum]|uniref:Uncharacterized protein n=1 Tax=Diphasiastrum complanatum TaxID=34168 RepID=A0ACC2EDV9_DIPCM|nr:hypothetical protein O6H91_02G027600 [Diphasiastrum complanatum]
MAAAAATPPSLLHLCSLALARFIEQDASPWRQVAVLPAQILSDVLRHLSPLALIALEQECGVTSVKNEESISKRKYPDYVAKSSHAARGRWETMFASVWKELFYRRWPDPLNALMPSLFPDKDYGCYNKSSLDEKHINWDQLYWQAHLQECLNEVSVAVSSPGFKDCIGDILIPGKLVKQVSSEFSEELINKDSFHCEYSTLKYLRLQSVLCSIELAGLLKKANLQWIRFYNIRMMTDLTGICQLLSQNKSTLQGVEFFNCIFSELSFNKLCTSIYESDQFAHHLQHWALVSSRILFASGLSSFIGFLRNGRSLCSIKLFGLRLQSESAASIANIPFESSIPLSVLCLNDNELGQLFAIETARMLQVKLSTVPYGLCRSCLAVLDLRSNCLNGAAILNLRTYFECLPSLQQLNLSHNPLGDDGIQSLLPYLKSLSVDTSSLVELRLAACNLSVVGATLLLDALASAHHPLRFLSIADNHLGRTFSTTLAKYLRQSSIQDLDIEEIGLDSSGCSSELQDALLCNKALANLNISKNRIGLPGAHLLSAIISEGQGVLKKINASFNMIYFESMCVLRSALQLNYESQHLGKMHCLDLRGNPGCINPQATKLFEEFCTLKGDPVVLLLNDPVNNLHDDDP